MSRFFAAITIMVFSLGSAQGLFAQQDYDLHFLSGTHNAAIQSASEGLASVPGEAINGRIYRLIQFDRIPSQTEKEAMELTGLDFLYYIPNFAYIVSVPSHYNTGLLSDMPVRTVLSPEPSWKMAPGLINGEIPAWAQRPGGKLAVNVLFYDDISYSQAVSRLAAAGFDVEAEVEWAGLAQVVLSLKNASGLASLPYVYFIEVVAEPGQPENYSGRTLHRSSNINSDHPLGMKYDGDSVNVMLQDDGIIGPHIDYEGRLLNQFLTSNNGDHGDHCAGIIMSAGNMDPEGRGMAPGANIYVYAASGYDGFANISTHYNQYDIRVSSTSYSDGCNAGYTSLTQTMDEQIYTYDHLIHVFSAGNNGTSNCSYGAGSGWGNVTGGHKMGKNVITVANLTYLDVIAGSSSRGPAHDGRIKPEIAAKGTSVYSTVDVNSYAFKTGTSMSCPGVAGTFAQLFQAYRESNLDTDPDGGMIKAIAMNTAEDLGNPGPDFIYGFGRINALRAVRTIENHWHLTDTISQNQVDQHTITVPANTAELRVMVYWTDYKGSVNTSKALVNDMDMSLQKGLNLWTPWVLDPTPNPVNLNLPATRGIDSLNNVEQITIDNPSSGTYTMTIDGRVIPQGPQKYYVVWYFVPQGIELTYPNGAEAWVPGEVEAIRWDAPEGTGTFSLEYSTNGGQSWTSVANNIGAAVRSYTMTVPTTVTGNALLKLTRGVEVDSSDYTFSIIGVPSNIQVNWSCPDSIGVSWNTVSGADHYELFMLGDKYMDSVAWSPTNSGVIVGANPMADSWISVCAATSQGKGRRAIAVAKPAGIFNCPNLDDISLTAIISPGFEKIYACQDLDTVPFSVEISNNSSHPLSTIPVKVKVDNGPTLTFTYAGTVAAGGSTVFSPSGGIDLSTPGSRNIRVWTDYPTDGWRVNDTMVSVVDIITGTPMSLPWSEDFESFPVCGVSPNCTYQECTVAGGFINQQNRESDMIDWITDNGGTYSSNTGPSADHTSGGVNGKYLYTEASGDCIFMQADLVTPCIDLVNAQIPVMEFWYHMYGTNMGELHIDVMLDGVWNLDVIPSISGNQGNAWRSIQVDLSDYTGELINIRFRGITGSTYLSDLAIDDISIVETVGLQETAFEPSFRVFPNPSSAVFNLYNDGLDINGALICVTDITGRVVLSKDQVNLRSGRAIELDLTDFSSGIYSLLISTPDGTWNVPLMKN